MDPNKPTDGQDSTQDKEPQTPEPTPEPAPEPSKRVPFEDLPLYAQKAIKKGQAAEERLAKIEAEKVEAEKKARIAKLEEGKQYEEALAQQAADHKAELEERDRENAKDKLFAQLRIAGYSEGEAELYAKGYDGGKKDGTPDEYLAKVQEKAPLPEPTDPKKPKAPPGTGGLGSVSGTLTKEQLEALEKDPDPKKRQEALDYKQKLIVDNYDKTGKWELPPMS